MRCKALGRKRTSAQSRGSGRPDKAQKVTEKHIFVRCAYTERGKVREERAKRGQEKEEKLEVVSLRRAIIEPASSQPSTDAHTGHALDESVRTCH